MYRFRMASGHAASVFGTNHRSLVTGIFIALTVLGARSAFGGAWTLNSGDGQVIFGALLDEASKAYDAVGNKQTTPRYRKIESEALIEYGVTDRLTAMLGSGLQHIDIASPVSAARTGVGYTEFGARFRFLEGKDWVLSAQALMRAPGTSNSANPAAIGYTGTEFDARVLLGKNLSLLGLPAFIDLELAQRFRNNAPNEFRADATLGLRVAPRWQIWAQSFTVIAEGSRLPLFPNYNYSKLQVSGVYDISKDWSAQLGIFATIFGRNALQENGLVAELCYRF